LEILGTLVIGIIGSLIAAIIFESIRNNSNWMPGPSSPPKPAPIDNEEDERALNKAKLKIAIFNGLFYFYTYFIIYISILFPPMLKAAFNKQPVFLSDAKIIGQFLPQITITTDYIQLYVVGIALVVYIPILLLVNYLSVPVSIVLKKYYKITIYMWRRIQGVFFLLAASLITIGSIWAFNDTTMNDAFFTFVGFVALAFVFFQANRK